ncbi:hypothetical protein CI109_100837 [Kwoniella shandongensis]|uniref:LCCL domain-containing protein n=1 Tax=Kwoniella shandongensis TaxID=1734106 RepID=A0AAJ8LDG2_9TREE
MGLPHRLQALRSKASSFSRRVLGPSIPTEPILPQPSCSISLTAGYHSTHLKLRNIPHKFTFPRALYPFLVLWLTVFILLIRQQYYHPSSPEILGCTAAPWNDWPPDNCGVNGTNCLQDLLDMDGKKFRCLGGCKYVTLGNPRWVGDEKVDKASLLIGGGDKEGTYRADSWICAAAIQSSLISSSMGGCVRFHALPFRDGFSTFLPLSSHGLHSNSFAPWYPGAFRLSSLSSTGCFDLHFIITGINAFCLFITAIFLSPPPYLLFTILLVLGYFHIVLFSDIPSPTPDWSNIFAGLPPVMMTGYWLWKVSFKHTMLGFRGLTIEQASWQGAGYWIGIESSTIFARLPITRLGYDPLDPAGVVAFAVIVVIVVIVVLIQAWELRRVGLLRYYLIRYLPLIPVIIILVYVPGYTLRIHHYILAIIAIPLLCLPNRISLFSQAFMLGLFLDGVGRWGWASILEQTTTLIGDGNSGTLIPTFFANTTTPNLLQWSHFRTIDPLYNITGYSVLIDDLQHLPNYLNNTLDISQLNLLEGINHHFRVAYIANGTSLDFTDPVTRWSNGSWGQSVS